MFQMAHRGNRVAEVVWHGVRQSVLCHGSFIFTMETRICLKIITWGRRNTSGTCKAGLIKMESCFRNAPGKTVKYSNGSTLAIGLLPEICHLMKWSIHFTSGVVPI